VEVADLAVPVSLPGDREGVWRAVTGAAAPSLRLVHAGPCDATAARSRLGGAPLAGPGFVWPHARDGRPLSLIGQLNTDDINAVAGGDQLPAGLVLAFFYDAGRQQGWGFDPADAQYWRVTAVAAAAAAPAPAPAGALVFPSIALAADRVLTVPDGDEHAVRHLWQGSGEAVKDVYRRLGPAGRPPRHRVFGWPDLVQGPMQLECQLASHGIYVGGPAGYRDPRAGRLRAGAGDWLLLWQIDTDDQAGWMWGDLGTIYYWIRRRDLTAASFDRVWMILQCS
jgi:uncharacterized protein YwqG